MSPQTTLSGKRILVVEDDYLAVADLLPRLDSMGVDVIGPAPSIEAAMIYLDAPDLSGAILDINLGGQMVFPLAEEMERRALPFLFATGYEREIIPHRYSDKVFLQKPLDTDAIAAALVGLHRTKPVPVKKAQAKENRILALLSDEELEQVLPSLQALSLHQGTVVEHQHQAVAYVYFPTSCIASLIAVAPDGTKIETGLIGREGITGFGLASGDRDTPYLLVNQIAGDALRMSVEDYETALQNMPSLRRLALRFSRSLSIQVSYTTLANGRFELPQRLARWLLMIADRIEGSAFSITHDYLSVMLGVRRAGVTNALHVLEGKKLIKSRRSEVIIINRSGLMTFTGGLYGIPECEYERLMGLPISRAASRAKINTIARPDRDLSLPLS